MSLLGPEGRKQLKLASRVGAVGFELALAICVGYFGGRWLDEHWDTKPYLMYLGFICGLIAGFKGLYDLAKRVDIDKIEE